MKNKIIIFCLVLITTTVLLSSPVIADDTQDVTIDIVDENGDLITQGDIIVDYENEDIRYREDLADYPFTFELESGTEYSIGYDDGDRIFMTDTFVYYEGDITVQYDIENESLEIIEIEPYIEVSDEDRLLPPVSEMPGHGISQWFGYIAFVITVFGLLSTVGYLILKRKRNTISRFR